MEVESVWNSSNMLKHLGVQFGFPRLAFPHGSAGYSSRV